MKKISRRKVLTWAGALSTLALPALISWGVRAQARRAQGPLGGGVFSLGVASGDPWPDGVVLWTRLAPDPLNGGGMPARPVAVQWQVAADDKMGKILQQGTAIARPELAHSVHIEVQGLEPARWYWYRFTFGSQVSPVGRTRTAPAPHAHVDRLRFAFASCQNYEQGYYTALRHMAEEDLDLVVHLGDYIYEKAASFIYCRRHNGWTCKTLEDYRNRHALYKSDPDLQAAHAAFPWVVTWDDHEVSGNWARDVNRRGRGGENFMRLRGAAFQAYYEHLPLRRSAMPNGSDMLLYRRLTFGNLAEFSILDTRQYRTDQSCGDNWRRPCAEALDPAATMLGPRQERWLLDNLQRSKAQWNVLAQQVPMMQRVRVRRGTKYLNMDKWDGYVAARSRLFSFLLEQRPANLIVLSGDVHAGWVANLKADFDNPASATLGTEFVTTSISSKGNGLDTRKNTPQMLANNPHIRFYNGQRGYVRCDITPETWQTDYRIVSFVTRQGAPIKTRASFVVENGSPGIKQV